METPDLHSDVWSEWLLHRRHADDSEYGGVVRAAVERYADRVLEGAQLSADMTLADVGAGEGLVAFRAINRIGPLLRVVLTDLLRKLRYAEFMALRRNVRSSIARPTTWGSLMHCRSVFPSGFSAVNKAPIFLNHARQ